MTLPLIRDRKKPHFGLPWLAILLGLSTLVFAFQGVKAVTASPEAQLEIVVEGPHPLNISQATVDAAMDGTIKTWKPLRMIVTPRLLAPAEKQGLEDPGADVILSTAVANGPRTSSGDRRFKGAGVSPADGQQGSSSLGLEIHSAYMDNVGLGHGPKAVAAAAQRAVDVIDRGPVQSPLLWLTGTVIGLSLTILALGFSLSRRKRRESAYRRLTAAQRKLAGVVLELDALEVSYRTTPVGRRTAGLNASWKAVRDSSLSLARIEDAAMEAVYGAKTALTPKTEALVKRLEEDTRHLVSQADALMGAGAVLGRLQAGQGVLDKVAAPMTLAARELLARLATRPAGVVSDKRVRKTKDALESLLGVLAADQGSRASLRAWRTAEFKLERSARAINYSLRSHSRARVTPDAITIETLTELRSGLGLSPAGSHRTLTALNEANAAALALLGPLAGTVESTRASFPEIIRKVFLPRPSAGATWILACVAMAVTGIITSAVFVGNMPSDDSYKLTGNMPLHSLTVDGDAGGIDVSRIQRYAGDRFTRELDVTVAVRSASDYLGIAPEPLDDGHGFVRGRGPQVLLDALWRVKAEFPALLEPSTGELLENQVIIPLWTLGDDAASVPATLAGPVSVGESSRPDYSTWDFGGYYFDSGFDYTVASAVRDVGRLVQNNDQVKPTVNPLLLFALRALAVFLGALALTMVGSYGGAVSMALGRFGRNADTLRQLRGQLNNLALGLDDSRINAVAMLGKGPSAPSAESDQRIYESALAMAWRIADDLAARPLSQRLSAAYVADVERLEQLVAALMIREGDVQRRTRKLLDTALGRT